MNTQKNSISDSALNQLLEESEFLSVPDDFEQRVMSAIDTLPEVDPSNEQGKTSWWQWLALLSAGIPGTAQLIAFIFSAWQLASVG